METSPETRWRRRLQLSIEYNASRVRKAEMDHGAVMSGRTFALPL
jgi:hypothetical protein